MYARALTVSEAEEVMLPVLKGPPVQCARCERIFDRITPGHLRTHEQYLRSKKGLKWFRPKSERKEDDDDEAKSSSDIEPIPWESRPETLMETYQRLFGSKDQLTACIKKLFDLYQPHRGKWLLMDKPVLPMYATWYQVSSDDPAFKPNRLCISILKEHLGLKCTVGVFPKSQYETHFLSWDIDAVRLYDNPSWNAPEEARSAARAITTLLRKWGLHPHIIISGRKGYHVTIFFQRGVPIKIAMQLYQAVLQHPDGPQIRTGLKVECLPIQRGNKLPLGINWSAERYCGFVDSYTLEPLENPYEYLLDIVPDDPMVLYEIEDEGLVQRQHKSTVIVEKSWSMDQTEAAFKAGIIAPNTRHDTLLRVAAHIRNSPSLCPASLADLIDFLLSWSRNQYEQHQENIGTRWSEHVKDVKRVAKYVWGHPLTPGVPREVRITASDVHWIRNQTSVLAEQQLMFAAWFQMSRVGEYFHFGYEQARSMTNLADDSLRKTFKSLREKGALVIEEEYFHGAKGVMPSKTRKYRFGNPPPKSHSVAVLLTLKADQWDSFIWFRILRSLYTVEELRSLYRYGYHRILKVDPLPLGRSTA